MTTEIIFITLSSLVIISYLLGILSRWTHIPSVLLLLAIGIAARQTLALPPFSTDLLNQFVRLLGAAGLVMIVLEASLDLRISKENARLVWNALLSAFFILLTSTALVALVIHFWFDTSWRISVVYAIPLSVISSAIVIPSAEHLPAAKREFVVYESSFSDILGILLFNFFTLNESIDTGSIFNFFGSTVLALAGSLVASGVLLWLVWKINTPVKFFLLFAVLFLLYAAGKLVHLPSLLLVLTLGLVLNNIDLLVHPKNSLLFDHAKLSPIIDQFRAFTSEISFFIRTFFFLLFGFSIELSSLVSSTVLLIGSAIVLALLVVRYVYFNYFLKTNLFPEILLMPRGLITILLFYSIPETQTVPHFDPGILFFVVVATTILMALGLVLFKAHPVGDPEFADDA